MEKMEKLPVEIDNSTCIGCGRCVRVCAAGIFRTGEEKTEVVQPELCIGCGHCADVCPVHAIRHPLFPAEKIHSYLLEDLPDPDRLMLLMKARRSNRAFSDRDLPETHIRKIIEAAYAAPTAQNSENVSLVVVKDPEKLRAISTFTIDTFSRVAGMLENPIVKLLLHKKMADAYTMVPKFKRLRDAFYKQQKDMILRNAKAVLLFCAPAKSRFGNADCNLAYQNASLMAESLGVAHFYTGFVLAALGQDKKGRLYHALGIGGERKIYAAMAMAMPAFRFERYADRSNRDTEEL